MKLELTETQKKYIETIKLKKRYGLFLKPGSGKTIISLSLIKDLMESGLIKSALIVAPEKLLRTTWEGELKKFDTFSSLSYSIRSKNNFVDNQADILLVTPHWLSVLRETNKIRFDLIVVDESHLFKSNRTKRYAAMRSFISEYMLLLSGTPVCNSLEDIWTQIYLLDRGQRLCKSLYAFRTVHCFYDTRTYRCIVKDEPAIIDKIKDICESGTFNKVELHKGENSSCDDTSEYFYDCEKEYENLDKTELEHIRNTLTIRYNNAKGSYFRFEKNGDLELMDFYKQKIEEVEEKRNKITELLFTIKTRRLNEKIEYERQIKSEKDKEKKKEARKAKIEKERQIKEEKLKKEDTPKIKVFRSKTPKIKLPKTPEIKLPKTLSADSYIKMSKIEENGYKIIDYTIFLNSIIKYKSFKKQCVADVGGNLISASNQAVLVGKLLQWTGGKIYKEDGTPQLVDTSKINFLCKLLETIKSPVIIAYNFKYERDLIRDNFPSSVIFDGKQDTVDSWNKGKTKIMLMQVASSCMGFNLQFGGNIIIWYSLTYSLTNYIQMNYRINRPGQKDKPIIIRIIASNTIDEAVIAKLAKKQDSLAYLLKELKS